MTKSSPILSKTISLTIATNFSFLNAFILIELYRITKKALKVSKNAIS